MTFITPGRQLSQTHLFISKESFSITKNSILDWQNDDSRMQIYKVMDEKMCIFAIKNTIFGCCKSSLVSKSAFRVAAYLLC